MYVKFPCGIIYGKLDSDLWEEEIEITDEEYERLREACSSGEWFADCEKVEDIYNRLHHIADLSATQMLLEYNYQLIESYIEDGKEFLASQVYDILIHWPEEWEEELLGDDDDEDFGEDEED